MEEIHKPWDYLHVNSVQELGDGNLLIGGRNTSAVYKVDRRTAAVTWSLGGKHSSFKMGPRRRLRPSARREDACRQPDDGL